MQVPTSGINSPGRAALNKRLRQKYGQPQCGNTSLGPVGALLAARKAYDTRMQPASVKIFQDLLEIIPGEDITVTDTSIEFKIDDTNYKLEKNGGTFRLTMGSRIAHAKEFQYTNLRELALKKITEFA